MLLRSIGRSQALADAIRHIAESGKLDKTWFREALLQQELRGLKCIGQIRLGGSLAIHVSQLLSSRSITAWRVAERFFAVFFGFFFDNTSTCYLVFAFFFLTLLPFILLLCYNVYRLEQLVCFSTRIYSFPHFI